jgi:hypothetical protein
MWVRRGWKVRKQRFLKKARKNFDYPWRLSGHTLADQTPGVVKVFLVAFFQKCNRFLVPELGTNRSG